MKSFIDSDKSSPPINTRSVFILLSGDRRIRRQCFYSIGPTQYSVSLTRECQDLRDSNSSSTADWHPDYSRRKTKDLPTEEGHKSGPCLLLRRETENPRESIPQNIRIKYSLKYQGKYFHLRRTGLVDGLRGGSLW